MTEHSRESLLLVDGSSYLYRAFHALPPLTNSRGEPTGAVYGVMNMLRRLLADHEPGYVAVVFDAKGKTFRDDLFESYKAHRPPMPDELRAQIAPLHALVRASGLPLLMIEGVEADDIIGTLAKRAEAIGLDILISTSDKDLAQLVNGHVTLINTMNNTVLDRQGVIEKFGVPPERIVDYLALVGDSSDNIPGVPKVGPKTAVKWLQSYGSLDGVIAHAGEISGKVGESLRENLDQLALSRQLATLHCGVPLPVELPALRRQPPDVPALKEWYQRLEFKQWLEQIGTDQNTNDPAPPAVSAAHYETLFTEEAFARWLTRLTGSPLFVIDLETTSLDVLRAEIVGISFAVEAGSAAYVPLAHDYIGAPAQLSRDGVLDRLKPLLEDAARPKAGHNLKYDMSVLANYDIHMAGIRFDTMLESYVLNSTASRHDMDSLALKHLNHKTITYEDVAGKGARQLSFNQVPVEQAAVYAAEDAEVTLRLHQVFWPQLAADEKLSALFNEIEMPLVPVLSRMERHGVLIDPAMLRRQSLELEKEMDALEYRARQMAGEDFNLASPKQIQEIFFGKLKLPVLERTPTGQPSTSEATLQELVEEHPLAGVILEHRALSKLKSTYTDRLPEQINPRTGRVHTSYHQAVAATGRLSSSDPNLQNIPVRGSEGRRIRQAFIAPPGYKILAADYSQIELRIMAHLSGDEALLRAFASGQDVHTATAAEIFGTAPEAVTPEQRRGAKAINFGLIYGMSAFGLARQLGIERDAAQDYVNRYFARYPQVKAFMDRMRQEARERGYVETIFGRRLYLPDIASRNPQRRQYAERAAINAPMQGTAADIIKRAMIAMDAWLQSQCEGAKMIMQVHDELVFEVPETGAEHYARDIRQHMTQAASLRVALVVDIGAGNNWDEAHY